MTSSKAIFTN